MGMWGAMTARSASPGGPWKMGGLGFGLPLSRLYARYFGARPATEFGVHGSTTQLDVCNQDMQEIASSWDLIRMEGHGAVQGTLRWC